MNLVMYGMVSGIGYSCIGAGVIIIIAFAIDCLSQYIVNFRRNS